MNSLCNKLCSQLEADVKAVGLSAYRAHALQHLELKAVVKESHCTPITHISFNHTAGDEFDNLFATVGKDQATVYDDMHMGDHVCVVVHFQNGKTQYHGGGDLGAAVWVSAEGVSPHPQGDAWLAVSGADSAVQVISVAEAAVVGMLKGHTSEVVELSAARAVPGLLLSLSKDGVLKLWDVPSETCLATINTDAFTAELSPDGSCFVTGHRGGRMCRWPLQLSRAQHQQEQERQQQEEQALLPRLVLAQAPERETLQLLSGQLPDTPDCIRFLTGDRLAAKSCDGRMAVWQLAADGSSVSGQAVASWRVPDASCPTASHRTRCAFGHTADGTYICVGNNSGSVYVYDTATGSRAAHVSAIKVAGPVRGCALSADCRHLLAVLGNGFIFRFEHIKPEDEEEEEEEEEEETGEDEGQQQQQPEAAAAASSDQPAQGPQQQDQPMDGAGPVSSDGEGAGRPVKVARTEA